MKTRLLLIGLALLWTGAAVGEPLKLVWTYPRFNAQAIGSCVTASDTLRDLARFDLVRVRGTDSTIVATRVASGMEARADSLTLASQPEGQSRYLLFLYDFEGNRSCASNPVDILVRQPPAPPSLR